MGETQHDTGPSFAAWAVFWILVQDEALKDGAHCADCGGRLQWRLEGLDPVVQLAASHHVPHLGPLSVQIQQVEQAPELALVRARLLHTWIPPEEAASCACRDQAGDTSGEDGPLANHSKCAGLLNHDTGGSRYQEHCMSLRLPAALERRHMTETCVEGGLEGVWV